MQRTCFEKNLKRHVNFRSKLGIVIDNNLNVKMFLFFVVENYKNPKIKQSTNINTRPKQLSNVYFEFDKLHEKVIQY